MKPLPAGTRVKNTGRDKGTCRWCDDSGYVVYGAADPHDEEWAKKARHLTLKERHEQGLYRENYGEMMAPCPYCEQGYLEEFPKTEKRKGEKAGFEASRIASPWGEDGFWASRSEQELVPAKATTEYLPREENVRRMRELMLRFRDKQVEAQEEEKPTAYAEIDNLKGLFKRTETIPEFDPEALAEEAAEEEIGTADDLPF